MIRQHPHWLETYLRSAQQRALLTRQFFDLDEQARQTLLRHLVDNALSHELAAVHLPDVALASGVSSAQLQACFPTAHAPLKVAIGVCVHMVHRACDEGPIDWGVLSASKRKSTPASVRSRQKTSIMLI